MSEDRQVFRSIKGLVHGNVVLNFRSDPAGEFDAVARGYHEAGKQFVAHLEKTSWLPDYLAYPAVFLYRHSMELYLKAIVLSGAKVVGLLSDEALDYKAFLSRHALSPMLPALQVIWVSTHWDWDFRVAYARTFDDFKAIIEEIESLDKESFAFRYPINKKMDATLPRSLHFNLFYFAHHLDPILECLDGAVTGIEIRWDNAAAIVYEAEQIIRRSLAEESGE